MHVQKRLSIVAIDSNGFYKRRRELEGMGA